MAQGFTTAKVRARPWRRRGVTDSQTRPRFAPTYLTHLIPPHPTPPHPPHHPTHLTSPHPTSPQLTSPRRPPKQQQSLASKFYTLYALLKDLLSKVEHYDWGLRAIKSVLVVAGMLLRTANEKDTEEDILMRALRDFNIPKIVAVDEVNGTQRVQAHTSLASHAPV